MTYNIFPRQPHIHSPSDRYWRHQAFYFVLSTWWRIFAEDRQTYVAVAARDRYTGECIESVFDLSRASIKLSYFLERHSRKDYTLLWSPTPYSHDRRSELNAMSTPFSWCTFPTSKRRILRPEPTIVWSISEDLSQALWVWHRLETPARAEAYSRALSTNFGGGRPGWRSSDLLHMPHTYNHNAESSFGVHVTWFNEYYQRRRPNLFGGKS
jgi:hypothetical protein